MFGLSNKFTLFFFGAAVFFQIFPQTDIFVSGLFWSPESGWFLAQNPIVLFFYKSVNVLTPVLPVLFILHLAVSYFSKKDFLGIRKKTVIFLFLVLLIGPGIFVSSVLKEHVGRARPNAVHEFGGEKNFTPPFVVTDQCSHNCSFVSGHASFGFYFITFSFLAVGDRRKKLYKYGFAYGALVGLSRIIQGGHFFSDTIFAFCFVFITANVVYSFMYKEDMKLENEN